MYSPSEKCKPIIECINSVDEPLLEELKNYAETGYQQLEKLSVIPLAVIALVILNRRSWIQWFATTMILSIFSQKIKNLFPITSFSLFFLAFWLFLIYS